MRNRISGSDSVVPLGSLGVGLCVPVVGVLGGLIFFHNTSVFILGIPLLYLWLFAWIPLTSVALWASWWLFDRNHFVVAETVDESAPDESVEL